MRPSPKRESLLKKLSRPNEDDTTKIRYCNAQPYEITYTNPTFHDLRSFPSAPLLNFRIQVTFLYHKGVCIELVLLIHVKIRKFGHFPLENEVNTGADFSEALLAWTPFTLAWFIYFPKQESESGRGTSLHIMYFQSYQMLSVLWACGHQIDFKNQIEPFETVQELKSNYSIAATFLSKWFSISSKHIE